MTKHKTKVCGRCSKEKSAREFGVRPNGYLRAYCKTCECERQKEYVVNNKDKVAKSLKKNKEAIAERKTQWRKNNPDYNKQYQIDNKEHINKIKAAYERKRIAADPGYKLKRNLRTRLYHALKGQARNGSAIRDMGCSVKELKVYLESQWLEGMNWDNWNHKGWHVDHIKPLTSFDLTDRDQLLLACHYTNLQPLWSEDNFRKGKR